MAETTTVPTDLATAEVSIAEDHIIVEAEV